MMILLHYSNEPIAEVRRVYQDGSDHRGSKPNGLWLSVATAEGSDSWKDFCKANNIALGKHCTEIVLKDGAKILRIGNAVEVDALTSAYGYVPPCPAHFLKPNPNYTRGAIHWDRVAETYDGVIIAPECIERRTVDHWYYTWDCSSGCIWSPNAVKALKSGNNLP